MSKPCVPGWILLPGPPFYILGQPKSRPSDICPDNCLPSRLVVFSLSGSPFGTLSFRDIGLPQIRENPNQLEQVLINLFQIALDALFGRLEGSHIMITMTSVNDGKAAQLEFADNGQGIRPEHLERVFEPLFATKDVGQGAGLGLSIADGIVMDHHGEMTCRPEVNQGTTLTLSLPAQGQGHA